MMNKFAKTMSNTTHKLKQKTGMAEKSDDTGFEGTRHMLNELSENAVGISKAFVKHAEALEGLSPSKQLNEGYKLDNQSVNLDMQDLYRSLAAIATDYGDKKKEVVSTLQKYILELQAVKEKVKKRDDLLVSYDKHNANVQSLSKNSKDENKLNAEKLKTQQYKDQVDTLTREITEEVQRLHEAQQENLSPAFHMIIGTQLDFFEKMANAYETSAVAY
eukprot:Phypoly_transcript_07858.p1 GENE.Phypoly_transcript_07858~~Phypoly_transcript_07858.p1  ORF type:complete len:218 (+),score=40.62 Phypoly_transcript_07858:888-1541(+)